MSDTKDITTTFTPAPKPGGALASTEQQRALGELQAQIMLAKMYPRDELECIEKIVRDCQNEKLAAEAQYAFARGGTDIAGPSIRLMEAVARRWGNLQSGIKEVSRDTEAGTSECVAYAWDVETGFRDEKAFVVRHFRDVRNRATRKMEQVRVNDERDIYEIVASAGQRRKRGCLQSVIPRNVTDAAVEQCNATLSAKADTSPEAMKRLLAAFADFNVTQAQIEKRIQRRLDAIRPAQVMDLSRVYASLKDGMSTPDAWFETPEPPKGDQPTDPADRPPADPFERAAAGQGQKPADLSSPGIKTDDPPAKDQGAPATDQTASGAVDAGRRPSETERREPSTTEHIDPITGEITTRIDTPPGDPRIDTPAGTTRLPLDPTTNKQVNAFLRSLAGMSQRSINNLDTNAEHRDWLKNLTKDEYAEVATGIEARWLELRTKDGGPPP